MIGLSYSLAKEVARSAPDAEASSSPVEICAASKRSKPLEKDTGLPVVTSNQAGLWQALRRVGIHEQLPNLGRLLREH